MVHLWQSPQQCKHYLISDSINSNFCCLMVVRVGRTLINSCINPCNFIALCIGTFVAKNKQHIVRTKQQFSEETNLDVNCRGYLKTTTQKKCRLQYLTCKRHFALNTSKSIVVRTHYFFGMISMITVLLYARNSGSVFSKGALN